MNRDYLNYSMNGPGPEATAWTNEYYQNPGQNNEIKRQMDEVFEQFFRYFAILLVLGVTISTARILQTGLILLILLSITL